MNIQIQKGKVSVARDQVIINEGSEATNRIFYLLKGTAMAEVKGKVVGKIEAGEWFGETAAILGAQRTATVRAITACEVIVFQGVNDGALLEAMRGDPKIVMKLIETLAMRVLEASRRRVQTEEDSSDTLERQRKAISGTLHVLEKVCDKYKTVKVMQQVREHLSGTSGIPAGAPEDVNMDFFAGSKPLITE